MVYKLPSKANMAYMTSLTLLLQSMFDMYTTGHHGSNIGFGSQRPWLELQYLQTM